MLRAWLTRKTLYWLVPGLALVTAGGFWGWKKFSAAPAGVTVVRRDLQELVEVSGTVAAWQSVTLKAETTGVLKQQRVPQNGRATRNMPLLQLDPTVARLQLEQAQAQAENAVAQARTQLDNALATQRETRRLQGVALSSLNSRLEKAELAYQFLQDELARSSKLQDEGAVTLAALETQQQQLRQSKLDLELAKEELNRAAKGAELVAADNAVAQARTALETAQRQGRTAVALAQDALNRTTLAAPFAGVVTEWLAEPGAWVTPGTPLAQFQTLDRLKLTLPVDELDVPKLSVGREVAIAFDAYPDEKATGAIVHISRASVLGSGNVQVFPVEVSFQDPAQHIRPGMSADARVVVQERPNVLAVPLGAIQREGGEFRVTVLKGRTREVRPVQTGLATLDYVEVLSGLEEGETIEFTGAAPSPKPSR
jgi:RND family efflux transporter MFP subunit